MIENTLKLKIIKNKSENLFASNVEEFMGDKENIVLGPPTYLVNENYYVAIIEYRQLHREEENK